MGLRSKSASKATTPTSFGATPSRTKTSRDEQLIRKAMEIHDAERERFVDNLKRSVWNGTYDPTAEEIADALLAERSRDRAAEY